MNDTVPSLLLDGWDTVHIRVHWEYQNDFRSILHPNYYWLPTTNVVYMGKEAKIACTHEIAGMIYTSFWVLRGVLINPEQLRLLVYIITEGGPSVTIQEYIHAALLLEFYKISFFSHET